MVLLALIMIGLSGGYAYLVWQVMAETSIEMEHDVQQVMAEQATGFIGRLVKTRTELLDAQLERVASVAGDGAKVMSRHLQRGGVLGESLSGLLSALAGRDTWAGRVYFLDASTGNVSEVGLTGMQTYNDKLLQSRLLSTTMGLATVGEVRWTEPLSSTANRNRLVVVALSPVSDGKKVLGFVGAEIPLIQLAIDSGRDDGFSGNYSFVIDARKRLIATNPVGRNQLDLVSSQNSVLPLVSAGSNKAYDQLLGKIAAGDTGVMKLELRNEPRYVAFHPMYKMPWRLIMVVPADAAVAAITPLSDALADGQARALRVILLGVLAILLPVVVIGLLLIRYMTHPIAALIDGANQIAGGNYAYRMPARMGGEFRQLAQAFDAMSEKIGRTVAEMTAASGAERVANQRLRDSIAELESLNMVLRDETEQRRRAETALRESEGRLKAIVSHARALIYLKDLQGRYLLANEPMQTLLQCTEQQILDKTDADLFPPIVTLQLQRNDQTVISNRTAGEFEENITLGVEPRIFLTSKFLLSDGKGRPYALGGIATDITARKRAEAELRQTKDNLDRIVEQRTDALKKANTQLALEIEERNRTLTELQESESRYALLVENIHDGVLVVQGQQIIYVNQVMADMLDADMPSQLIGRPMLDLVAPDERIKLQERYEARLSGGSVESVYESTLLSLKGRRVEVELSVGLARFKGETGTVAVLRDIALRKAAEVALQRANAELMRMSVMDSLTGLYNRRYLMSTLDAEFARAMRHGVSLSVLMIDVDYFKNINDSYGHQCGDQVLMQVANLIQSRTRQSDTAARYGGEELTLLLPETDLLSARLLADSLCKLIAETPFKLEDGQSVQVTVSIGVAGIPICKADSVSQLLELADESLYRAKRLGRNRVEVAAALN